MAYLTLNKEGKNVLNKIKFNYLRAYKIKFTIKEKHQKMSPFKQTVCKMVLR